MNTQISTICSHAEALDIYYSAQEVKPSLTPYPIFADPLAHTPPANDSAERNQSRSASLPNAIQPLLIMIGGYHEDETFCNKRQIQISEALSKR
jgi:hypothetical protein